MDACRGYILTGGQSSRMGRDKALLPFGGRPLAVWMAELLRQVCAAVTLVGSREMHSGLGVSVTEDVFPGRGPLAGIHAALSDSSAPFSLVLGCDMPYVTPEFLRELVEIARSSGADAVVPESEAFGYEPLCAVYGRNSLLPIEQSLRAEEKSIRTVLGRLRLRPVTTAEWKPFDPCGRLFLNLNTPEDYEEARKELLAGSSLSRPSARER